MSYNSKLPDPQQAWSQILERLYHEDEILYARMNNFSTVQAFLATALAFATSATTTARNISLIVMLFGLVLSLFYIALGFRGVRVIQFWRAYLRVLESIPGMTSIDSHLSEFYRLGRPARPGRNGVGAGRGPGRKCPYFVVGAPLRARPVPMVSPGFFGDDVYCRRHPRAHNLLLAGGALRLIPPPY